MTRVQHPYHRRSTSLIGSDNIQLLVGMLFGAILMFWCLGPSTIRDDNFTTGGNHDGDYDRYPSSSSRSTTDDSGWKQIHVFYGDRASLPGLKPDQKYHAQVHQDEIILDLIGTSGYFLDLAANDAVEFSNTLALEQHEGWNGLCIEPNHNYWYGLAHRKCTVVAALVGGGTTMQSVSVEFRGVFGGIVGKLDRKLANRKQEPRSPQVKRYTAPFQDVLRKFHVPTKIDYLSLDVEGAEYLIMQDFPFHIYQIQVLTIERPSPELRTLLQQHGYLFLKDLAWWGETLWAHESTGLSPSHPKIQNIQTEERT